MRVNWSGWRDRFFLAVEVGRIAFQRLLPVIAPEVRRVIRVRHALAKVAVVVVEAEIERAALLLRHPQAPLADDGSGVAGFLQELRDGDGARFHAVLTFLARRALHIVAHGRMAEMLAGHERATARRTDAATCIEIRELHPLRRDAVEVRRLDLRLPVAAEVAPSEVVGQDEDDVGSCPVRSLRGGAQRARAAK